MNWFYIYCIIACLTALLSLNYLSENEESVEDYRKLADSQGHTVAGLTTLFLLTACAAIWPWMLFVWIVNWLNHDSGEVT